MAQYQGGVCVYCRSPQSQCTCKRSLQALKAERSRDPAAPSTPQARLLVPEEWVSQHAAAIATLADMGFASNQVIEALYRSKGDITVAGDYLARQTSSSPPASVQARKAQPRAPQRFHENDPIQVKLKDGWVRGVVRRVQIENGQEAIYVRLPSNVGIWIPAVGPFIKHDDGKPFQESPRDGVPAAPVLRPEESPAPATELQPQAPDASRTKSPAITPNNSNHNAAQLSPNHRSLQPASGSSGSLRPDRLDLRSPTTPAGDRPPASPGGRSNGDGHMGKAQSGSLERARSGDLPTKPVNGADARGPVKTFADYTVGTFLDVRDTVGKWLEAEVVEVRPPDHLLVHFIRWDSKWDEWIQFSESTWRFATFHLYSAGPSQVRVKKGDEVFVRPPIVDHKNEWIRGQVRRLDGPQVQVQFDVAGTKYQYWFHVDASEEIVFELGKAKPAVTPQTYFLGQYLEVLDTERKWLPAQVKEVAGTRIFVHYENWSTKWDEWINLETHGDRVRALGAMLEPTIEEKNKKHEEDEFRRQLKEMHGFEVIDCDKDGNCLFRSIAHQVYNDAERHEEVRRVCYDYMERDRDFFSMYIGEDFDDYVKRQRQLNQWGDHVEIVAMREIFNKNVEIYDKDHVKAPKPLGLTHDLPDVKTVRLSYHGQSHYNSVVDPQHPPPLGDGKTDPIKLVSLRVQDHKSEASDGDLSSKPSRPTVSVTARVLSDFEYAWYSIDKTHVKSISARDAKLILNILLRSVYKLRLQEVDPSEKDTLEDLKQCLDRASRTLLDSLADALLAQCGTADRKTILFDKMRKFLEEDGIKQILVAFSR